MKHKCDECRYKGEHREMMFKPMGVCLREANLIEAAKNYSAEKCPYKKFKKEELNKGCLVCSNDYNQEIISTLIRYHTSDETVMNTIETKFCPNCGRRLNI